MSAFDLDEVRAALQAQAVLDFYGWKAKRESDELVSRACPARADHTREAFKINHASGRWQCFPCGTAGDLFDFIAAMERLSVRADFGAVLTKAAEIAGVGPSTETDEERKRKRDEWCRRRQEQERRDVEARRARDVAAVPTATAYWNELLAKHARGFEYLCERRVGDVILCRDTVRFDPRHAGSPAVALHSSDGSIRNVVARRVPELGEPKTPGLRECPTAGTLVHSVADIKASGDVVLTEGVMDSITARLAWAAAVVLGAHGAGNLPKVAKVAAPIVAQKHARMIVVPHGDKRGYETASEACRLAVEAGLSISKGTLRIIKHGQKDLNDAWRLGWRAA